MDNVQGRQAVIEDDMGSLGLVMLALIKSLVKKGIISTADIKEAFGELDALDGEMDGKIDLSFLRSSLGVVAPLKKK